jgi:hypothetical protein
MSARSIVSTAILQLIYRWEQKLFSRAPQPMPTGGAFRTRRMCEARRARVPPPLGEGVVSCLKCHSPKAGPVWTTIPILRTELCQMEQIHERLLPSGGHIQTVSLPSRSFRLSLPGKPATERLAWYASRNRFTASSKLGCIAQCNAP